MRQNIVRITRGFSFILIASLLSGCLGALAPVLPDQYNQASPAKKMTINDVDVAVPEGWKPVEITEAEKKGWIVVKLKNKESIGTVFIYKMAMMVSRKASAGFVDTVVEGIIPDRKQTLGPYALKDSVTSAVISRYTGSKVQSGQRVTFEVNTAYNISQGLYLYDMLMLTPTSGTVDGVKVNLKKSKNSFADFMAMVQSM